MSPTYIGIVSKDEYHLIRQLRPNSDLPATFQEWKDGLEKRLRMGGNPVSIDVKLEDFRSHIDILRIPTVGQDELDLYAASIATRRDSI
jgi:hypothetical protein